MSAPGYTPIQMYYSTTASAQPTVGNLITAELAVNVTDKKIYSKDGGGNLITLVGTLGNQDATSVAVGTFTASNDSAFNSTGALKIPVGTTAQQPTGANGKIRYNTDISKYEGYSGSTWSSLGGGATGGGGDEIFIENGQTVTTSYSIPSGKNAMSTGAITINSGVSVTVPSGSRWVIL